MFINDGKGCRKVTFQSISVLCVSFALIGSRTTVEIDPTFRPEKFKSRTRGLAEDRWSKN